MIGAVGGCLDGFLGDADDDDAALRLPTLPQRRNFHSLPIFLLLGSGPEGDDVL